jgi:hypothetical protein
MTGVTVVKMRGCGGVTFAGFHRHQPLGTMREALVFDGSESVLRQKAGKGATQNDH